MHCRSALVDQHFTHSAYSAYLWANQRADERTRTACPCSLRVIHQALQGFPWRRLRERRGGRIKEQQMLCAQESLPALCVEVDVNDRGAFLFAEHDERDSLSRPYGEGYGLVEEVVVVRDFLLQVIWERVYRQLFTSH
jgi:hypothetical protein